MTCLPGDDLMWQVSELEHRLAEAKNQLADSEHETRQLRGHVSRQEVSISTPWPYSHIYESQKKLTVCVEWGYGIIQFTKLV